MPVDITIKDTPIYQREQYGKGGIGRIYWDYRDRVALSYLDDHDFRVADIGCGEGITLEKLVKIFPHKDCLGLDGLIENLFICAGYRLKTVGGDVFHLPFQNNSIDCVLLLEVIEHLLTPERAIGEIHRVIRPDGKLIVLFPNDLCFKIARLLTLKFNEASYNPGHVRQWTPKDIRRSLTLNGFKIIARKNIPFRVWQLSLHHLVVCEKNLIDTTECIK